MTQCDDCSGPNPVWYAPNALWNLVMGGPEAKDDPGGMICPVCFIKRAEDGGHVPTAWMLHWELRPETEEDLAAVQPRDLSKQDMGSK